MREKKTRKQQVEKVEEKNAGAYDESQRLIVKRIFRIAVVGEDGKHWCHLRLVVIDASALNRLW